jgi:putative transcriptional regulator
MSTKTKENKRLNEALLEMAQDGLLSKRLADKITMRVLGARGTAKPTVLEPEEIRTLRERANMSQAVFARLLNVTTGYVSQLERGAKRPTGPALALLHVIKRKGIDAIL